MASVFALRWRAMAKTADRVRAWYEQHPGASVMDVSRALGISRASAHYHMVKLPVYAQVSGLKVAGLYSRLKRIEEEIKWIITEVEKG